MRRNKEHADSLRHAFHSLQRDLEAHITRAVATIDKLPPRHSRIVERDLHATVDLFEATRQWLNRTDINFDKNRILQNLRAKIVGKNLDALDKRLEKARELLKNVSTRLDNALAPGFCRVFDSLKEDVKALNTRLQTESYQPPQLPQQSFDMIEGDMQNLNNLCTEAQGLLDVIDTSSDNPDMNAEDLNAIGKLLGEARHLRRDISTRLENALAQEFRRVFDSLREDAKALNTRLQTELYQCPQPSQQSVAMIQVDVDTLKNLCTQAQAMLDNITIDTSSDNPDMNAEDPSTFGLDAQGLLDIIDTTFDNPNMNAENLDAIGELLGEARNLHRDVSMRLVELFGRFFDSMQEEVKALNARVQTESCQRPQLPQQIFAMVERDIKTLNDLCTEGHTLLDAIDTSCANSGMNAKDLDAIGKPLDEARNLLPKVNMCLNNALVKEFRHCLNSLEEDVKVFKTRLETASSQIPQLPQQSFAIIMRDMENLNGLCTTGHVYLDGIDTLNVPDIIRSNPGMNMKYFDEAGKSLDEGRNLLKDLSTRLDVLSTVQRPGTGQGQKLLSNFPESTSPLSSGVRAVMASSSSSTNFQVFVSHAGEDKATIAIPLRNMLRNKGITAFVDDKDMPAGSDAKQAMIAAMETALVGLIILSPEFVAREWPMKELLRFLKRREEARGSSYPILIPMFYRLSISDLYHEPRLDRQRDDGTSLYESSRFYERQGRGDPEADIPTIQSALRALHGITGVRNDFDASNASNHVMHTRREILLRLTCDKIVEALSESLC